MLLNLVRVDFMSLPGSLAVGFHKVSSLSVDRLEITVPVGWALNTNN